VLDHILRLMHPVMPYITEEIWQAQRGSTTMLMREAWPKIDMLPQDASAMTEIRWVIDVITLIRSVRSELNVPAAAQINVIVRGSDGNEQRMLKEYRDLIFRMARLADISFNQPTPDNAAQAVLGKVTFILPLANVIDLAAERTRLDKERQKLQEEIDRLVQKLQNPNFVDKAPPEVIDEHRERLETAKVTLGSLDAARAKVESSR
jgi:valyl-tRNA synthetase